MLDHLPGAGRRRVRHRDVRLGSAARCGGSDLEAQKAMRRDCDNAFELTDGRTGFRHASNRLAERQQSDHEVGRCIDLIKTRLSALMRGLR